MATLRSQQSGVFAFLGVVIFIFFVSFYYNSSSRWQSSGSISATISQDAVSTHWNFNPSRDAGRYGLSLSQCDKAFPKLWNELERSAKYRQTVGNVKPEDTRIDWGNQGTVRAMIYNNQVRFELVLTLASSFHLRSWHSFDANKSAALHPRNERMHTTRFPGAIKCDPAFNSPSCHHLSRSCAQRRVLFQH